MSMTCQGIEAYTLNRYACKGLKNIFFDSIEDGEKQH
jgi:hypothetical protein